MSAAAERQQHLLKLAMQAWSDATGDEVADHRRALFERLARERMAQAAQVWTLEVDDAWETSLEVARAEHAACCWHVDAMGAAKAATRIEAEIERRRAKRVLP